MSGDGDESHEAADLVIIGAGIYGIQAARTYLDLHPSRQVVVLEAAEQVGGVWAQRRVYDEFWTQTPLGMLEFSDQQMLDIPENDQFHGFFRAKYVSYYLNEYCEGHLYAGVSLASRIRTHMPVQAVYKAGNTWNIVAGSFGELKLQAPHVIDASGLTSIPNWPELPGRSAFKGQILHHKDFAKFEAAWKADDRMRVVVVGGAKSAADVAYSCAKVGHNVTWLIRRSGSGPAAFVSARGSMGYANSNEVFYTRLSSLFLVSLFSLRTGYAWLLNRLNRSFAGQWLLRQMWRRIDDRAHEEANYDRADGQKNGFSNLKPDTEIFWQNDSTGINQRTDFFDVIAKQTLVVREDISGMNEHGVILEDASRTCINADAIICCTGWKSAHPYLTDQTAATLGLPVRADAQLSYSRTHWDDLEQSATDSVFQHFPLLDSHWAHRQCEPKFHENETESPFRLWKSIVPVQDPSILFVGKIMLGNHFRAAEVQALFACAIFDGAVTIPSKEEAQCEVAQTLSWCRRRYLKKGCKGNWFYWDMVPYTDMLLNDMGLKSHRHDSRVKDLLSPCMSKDLAGLVDEYRNKHGCGVA